MHNSRILIISERFFPEQFLINDLVKDLENKKQKFDVLTQVPSYPQDKIYNCYKNVFFQIERKKHYNIYRVKTILGYNSSIYKKIYNYINFALLTSIISIFIGWKYVNVFVYHTGPLTQAIPILLLKLLYKTKVTIWTQDIWPDTVYAYGFKKRKYLVRCLEILVRLIYNNCDNIVVSSEGFIQRIRPYVNKEVKYLPQWFPEQKIFTIDFEKKFGSQTNFTFAGNIGKVQNLENVILGFEKAAKSHKNIQLNLVGTGSHIGHLKKIVRERSIKNIIFWGFQKIETIQNWLMSSDFLIISLLDRDILNVTIPAKFQAYLTAKRPIMGILKGELASLIVKKEIGLIANPSNTDSIAEKFLKLSMLTKKEKKVMEYNMNRLLEVDFNREVLINKLTKIILFGGY